MSKKDNSNDNDLFRHMMSDVKPLKTETIEPSSKKPSFKLKKHNNIEFTQESNSHHKTQIEDNAFFAFHISKKDRKRLKSGQYTFDATLDLHGHTVTQSERLLKQFISDCQTHRVTSAIIVHGQGHHSSHGAILKPAVLYWLNNQSCIEAFCPAQQRDGGLGATYILIKES